MQRAPVRRLVGVRRLRGRGQRNRSWPRPLRGGVADRRPWLPGLPVELRHLVVDEPWIAAHFSDTGTHDGPFLGVPATGRRVSTQEFAFYRVDGDLITEVWVTADNLHLLGQLR
ncbi:ester cyclase [Solirubrobacter sp. CPCC 204708]|uniref:Ester cyclase n=1 Tax=Solirubrobacter deserti TaxID=2282478 RepID=A0ABT4RQH2_9ACTN|nr:ester cyclase [Solirubrobacter deserti]MDA0140805.1 ester cyclase [Solirubrobacter deserti]